MDFPNPLACCSDEGEPSAEKAFMKCIQMANIPGLYSLGPIPEDSDSVNLEEDVSISFCFKSPTGSAEVPFGMGTTALESLQFQAQTFPTIFRWLQTERGIGN